MIASIRELRSATKEILSAVSRGDIVWVTSRGKTCAKITPFDAVQSKHSVKDEAFGMWKGDKKTKDVPAYIRKIRKWRRAH